MPYEDTHTFTRMPTADKVRFAEEYVSNGENASKAYRTVHPDVTIDSAQSLGPRLSKMPEVRKLIDAARLDALKDLKVTTNTVLKALLNILMFDPKDLVEDDGTMVALKDIPYEARMALAGVEVSEMFEGSGAGRERVGMLHKYKTNDRVRAAELIGKHLKMWTDKLEVDEKITLSQMIAHFEGKSETPEPEDDEDFLD